MIDDVSAARDVVYRPAEARDVAVLHGMLVEAVNWRADPAFDRALLERPRIAHYVSGWPTDGDVGVVAECAGRPVGAAWARLFGGDDPGYGYVADDLPEITIGVADGHRGQGVGGALLRHLIEAARRAGAPGLSLSVEDGNPARRLYDRTGFAVVGREGGADTMCLMFDGGSTSR